MDNKLMRRANIVFLLIILIGLSFVGAVDSQNLLLKIDKNSYDVGEKITIAVQTRGLTDTKLKILSPTKVYQYMNPGEKVFFIPSSPGNYVLEYYSYSSLIDSLDFTVLAVQTEEPKVEKGTYLYLPKDTFDYGEEVPINIDFILAGKDYTLTIKTPVHEYTYVGIYKSPILFYPTAPGRHEVSLTDSSANEVDNKVFMVGEEIKAQEPEDAQIKAQPISLKIKNSKSLLLDADVTILKETKSNTILGALGLGNIKTKRDVMIVPTNKVFKSFELKGVTSDSIELGFDVLEKSKVHLKDKEVLDAYAIDPSSISFESGTFTKTAKGNVLYKCKDYDFYSQTCNGEWVKQMNLIPGQEYSITIDSMDPAYAEVGLASINTNKPIYHPYEDVILTIVVLDNQGYLVDDADVTLSIMNPNGILTTFSTQDDIITRKDRGIYETTYTRTTILGEYSLSVSALGLNVNNTMDSYFLVAQNYDFDILRNTPVTTDPFLFPFSSEITIISYGPDEFNFTETLPASFEIVDDGGAIISQDSEKIYLNWIGLHNGSTVSYVAYPPLITPELYELRSYVSYDSTVFEEARPWFLAVDPLYNQNFYASSYSSSGTVSNAQEIDSTPDNVYGSMAFNDEAEMWTYNFNLPETGTIYNASLMIEHYDSSTSGDDELCIKYRIGSGGTWLNLDGTTFTLPGNGNCPNSVIRSLTDRSDKLPITGSLTWAQLQNIQLGVHGNKIRNSDGVTTYIDAIWLRLDYSPPPSASAWDKNATTVGQNDSVTFNSTWSDDVSLNTWIFAINQTGTWQNRTVQAFSGSTASYSITINATSGSVVQWRFYANDGDGAWNSTPIQSFTVQSGPDIQPPTISNLAVTPSTGISGQQFNITATITDNVGVEEAWAEITTPNGVRTNYSMSLISGTTWKYTYTGNAGGNYSAIVYAKDATNYNVSSTRVYFNVTAYTTIDSYYYKRGDSVSINGYGFSATNNVSLDIKDSSGTSVSGYPLNVATNSNGAFSTTWTIPSSTLFHLDNFTVYTADNIFSWLSDSEPLSVIVKASTAVLYDDNYAGLEMQSKLNDSDNNLQRIRSSQNEDYIEMTFPSIVPTGYNVDAISLYIEHQEVSANTIYIKWLNGSAWQTVCTITASTGSEIFSGCNLLPYISDSTAANSISLRISDNNAVGNNVEWTDIDFVYIYANFSISSETTIIINEPQDTTFVYDFTDTTNNKAYDGIVLSIPATILTGDEATPTEYGNMLTDDGSYFQTIQTGNTGNRTYQTFSFKVTQSSSSINSFVITHNGRATEKTSDDADGYSFYIWNSTSGSYQSFATASANSNDQTTTIIITDGFDTLKDASSNVNILVIGDFANGGGANAKSQLFTDLMKLEVNTMKVISGIQTVNVTAVDSDGVAACYYQVRNTTGTSLTSWIPMQNTVGNIWINYSNTLLFSDGLYDYYANCTDSLGNSNADTYVRVRISNSAPSVSLVYPINYANITLSNLNFTWNVTDGLGGNPYCNLTINNQINKTSVISNNGYNTTTEVLNFADGIYNWSVSCWNDAGLSNTSSVWNYTIDTTLPSVSLVTPGNNSWSGNNNLTLYYTPYDLNGVKNCSLYVNGAWNQQNVSISNGVQNYFQLSIQPDGLYTWQVYCTDNFGWTNFSGIRRYYVDTTKPNIVLETPGQAASLSNISVQFNFTVFDALSTNMSCNLTVNNIVEDTNFQVLNGSKMSRNLTIYDGLKNWNVTCSDNAFNTNTSETWNFTISAPPLVELKSPLNNTAKIGTNANFTYYVADGDGIKNCSLYLEGVYNTSTSYPDIINLENNSFLVNFSESRAYTWEVRCYDNLSTEGTSETRVVLIDNIEPKVILYDPVPDETFTELIVNFNFTATDNYLLNLSCNLTVDSLVRGNYNFANNTFNSVNISLGDGYHSWNVTCRDNATLFNTSETRNFTIRGPPTLNLTTPLNNTWQNGQNINFTYYVSDIDGIRNCSLYIDGSINKTNYTSEINNGGYNTFNVVNLPEGNHLWTVGCYDTLGFHNMPTEWTVRIDNINPTIFLSEPVYSANLSQNLVIFNFTVTDNYASNLSCNLTINSTLYPDNANLTAINGSITLTNQTLGEGEWFWNVTCADFANNKNTSETYKFFIDAGPAIDLIYPSVNASVNGAYVNFTYYVADISGVNNCSLYINDILTKNETTIQNYDYNDFNLSSMSEGYYNWSVYCYDTENNLGMSDRNRFLVDNNAPVITPYYPDGITLNSNDIIFNFTVTDNYALNISCNLSIDDTVEAVNINATNNTITYVNVTGIPDGNHNWTVKCWDNASNNGYSMPLYFTIDAAPDIFLVRPLDKNATENRNVSFFYQVSDTSLSNCSLIINNVINQTNTSVQIPYQDFDGDNNFTIYNMAEGEYNWTVNCTDSNGFVGYANDGLGNKQIWLLSVDLNYPWVELNYPEPAANLSSSLIRFNFTAYDSVDSNLTCNLSINNVVNQTNAWALNNISREILITGFAAGTYTWNVTCWDDANHINNSETRNFTLISTPSVTLISPQNYSSVNSSSVNLTFLPNDLEGISFCEVYVDDINEDTLIGGVDFITGYTASYLKTGLSEGLHSWYINCTDIDLPSNTVVSDEWHFYTDTGYPWVIAQHPDDQVLNTSTVTFNWTAYDAVDPLLSCNVYVNNSILASAISSPNNSMANVTRAGFIDGEFFWNVTCTDDAHWSNYSLTLNFSVQEPPRVALISPENGNRTNQINQTLYYIPYDNSGSVSSCFVLLNMIPNTTSISPIIVNISNNLTVPNLIDGKYNWTINCTDPSGNSGYNSTERNFIIDLLGPAITLVFPEQDGVYNYEDINFTWNATDMWATNLLCNLTIDDQINVTNITAISGAFTNRSVYGLSQGKHNWSMTCIDDLNNINTSYMVNFTVNAPDLTLNNTHISFNNTNPDENETISVTATIFNIGGATAYNIPVEFWDGTPQTGTRINGVQTIPSLISGANTAVNVSWNISLGMHNIYVIINYTGVELNDTNNNATVNISVLYPVITSENNTWTNSTGIELNFTLYDFTGKEINYSILVDGVPNGQTGTSTDGIDKLLNVSLSEGIHNVSVRATDYLSRIKTSPAIKVYVDRTSPRPRFETPNEWWFNDISPEIFFNITDNLDLFIDYSLYVNDSLETFGIAQDGVSISINLSDRSDGYYNLSLNATDNATNTNRTSILIYIDTVEPTISLLYPGYGDSFTSNQVELNFSVYDALDQFLGCNLTLDGSVNRSLINASRNAVINTSVFGLGEGTHYWNVSCWDGGLSSNINNVNTSETSIFNIYVPPRIDLISPEDNNWTAQTDVTFYFNASDDTGIENCSILINGQVNDTKPIVNGAISSFTVNNMDGTYNWSIQCYDNTSMNMYSRSENRTINVDLYDPEPYIETVSGTWFNTGSPLIQFNITDNMDDELNYTFFVNGTSNRTGVAVNGSHTSDTLISLMNGTYTIVLEATDNAGNKKNSTSILIHIDTAKPNIVLVKPENGNVSTNTNMYFEFLATDNVAENFMCNLTVDNIFRAGFNVSSGLPNSTILSILAGTHYWNVTCVDLAGNYNTSETWNFTIPLPDLYVSSSDIHFNTSNFEEGTNITINATVFNIGDTTATNAVIQFFEGNYASGRQINGNFTHNISAGGNITVNVSWKISGVGDFDIYVVADPPISTNGTIHEANETNNYAYSSINVGSYHLVYGNLTGLLDIEDINNQTIYQWDVNNYNGSKIYTVDYDSIVEWSNLQAISRDINGNYVSGNFHTIDLALSMENNSDSINNTWTLNNNPRLTKQYVVYLRNISNVPVVNSTNTTMFQTGILWDMSDGNTQFNGTQDLVFLTTVNANQTGKYGTYDYELKIPSNLKKYKGSNLATVSLYTELN